ncbi:MAG: DUF4160 domain-containing protein [Nitrospirae bacterium]|nr:DUF4160 domain-containing protein [Nitrospirota bacterium]
MPTVKNISSQYRFFFYSFDCNEPRHIHVQKGTMACKFWLVPIVLNKNFGFSPKELNIIREIISNNKTKILEAWDAHCNQYYRSAN